MNTIKVNKTQLLETLKKNRTTHIEEFKEAQKGYREECIKQMKDNFELASTGGEIKTALRVSQPHSYEKDYDRAIAMLEWSLEDTVELTVQEFEQYVNDEWQWQHGFKTVNAMYLSK